MSKISNAEFLRWFKPVIEALRELGGSGTPKEVRDIIIQRENLTDDFLAEVRGKSKVNKFENDVAFARSYLVYAGYIDNSVRGVWVLTEDGKEVDMTDELASEIMRERISANAGARGKAGQAIADKGIDEVHYWIYSPGDGASKWEEFCNEGIMGLGWEKVGDLDAFTSKEEIKDRLRECYESEKSYKYIAHALWSFAKEMKVGDVIFVKRGLHKIIGRGVVEGDYDFDESRSDGFSHIRKVKWTDNGEWEHPGAAVAKALTDLTQYTEYVEKLNALFGGDLERKEVECEKYDEKDFLSEVFMSPEKYKKLVETLKYKKNIVLQGAPGVGKTYAAKRIAYSMMGVRDPKRVKMVQFHQSYSYEDFIMGFRPAENGGFRMHEGPFYKFCREIDDDKDYFFIIDEINRGNISKIFGELFMLIEADKRGIELELLYRKEKFSVPENVYIIGMMNTADRSLAMLDYALRRRFAFFEFEPAFETEGFKEYTRDRKSDKLNNLISCVEELNRVIANDESLGRGFQIGHSYFITDKPITDEWLSSVVEFELIPLLNEYWFDEISKADEWGNRLRRAIK